MLATNFNFFQMNWNHRRSSRVDQDVVFQIGPTRLNYARVIPMVDYTAQVVGRILGEGSAGTKRE